MTRVPNNVRRGAAYLDERLPGWRQCVESDRLDLASGCNCVLGQIFRGYEDGVEVLGLTRADERRLGFWRSGQQSWAALTEGWRRIVEEAEFDG